MNLPQHREVLHTIQQQRKMLDEQFAKAIAVGVRDGHSVSDLLDPSRPSADQPGFDL